MTCPCCGSVIIIQNPVSTPKLHTYTYNCQRCLASIEIAVHILQSGDPALIQKYQNWLHERG